MRSAIIWLAGLAALTGCASDPYAGSSVTTPPDLVAAIGRPLSPVAVRRLAGPDSYLGPMPTAVVILRRGEDYVARNRAFCEAYQGMPALEDMVEQRGARQRNLIEMRWPIASPDLFSQLTPSCETMVAGYDYARGEALLQDFDGAERPGDRGPHILQIMPDGQALLLDGSPHAQDDLAAWTQAWVFLSSQQSAELERGVTGAGPVGKSPAAAARPEPTPRPAQARGLGHRFLQFAQQTFMDLVPNGKAILGGVRALVNDPEGCACEAGRS